MKRLFAFLLAGLMLISCKAAEQKGNKSLLWRITGKGLKQPSYLFGTMHLICPDDYVWTDAMKRSLAACGQVCFELDMDDPDAMMEASGGFMSTDGKKLQDYFTAEQWKRLSQFMRDTIGADISQMQMMKPMVLESLLTAKSVDCAFPISYEANIMEQAQKAKQNVVGMEEVQEQVAVINSLPDDSVVAALMQTIDSFSTAKAEYAKMLAAYKQQDLPALFEQIKASKELQDELGAFLDDRNKKWIPRMAKMMVRQPTFFAVGAGHLWGEAGVIDLLRTAGYTVVPVH
jgi:uncharacterized protein YbaP (TraB family)